MLLAFSKLNIVCFQTHIHGRNWWTQLVMVTSWEHRQCGRLTGGWWCFYSQFHTTNLGCLWHACLGALPLSMGWTWWLTEPKQRDIFSMPRLRLTPVLLDSALSNTCCHESSCQVGEESPSLWQLVGEALASPSPEPLHLGHSSVRPSYCTNTII